MDKVIKDGKVAVVYSPGFGAGWSTWNPVERREALCMDARIVQAVLSNDMGAACKAARKVYRNARVLGGDHLRVAWVPCGAQFEITECGGSESV